MRRSSSSDSRGVARCMARDRFHAAVRLAPTTAGRGAPAKSGRRQRRRAAESDRQLDARVDGPRQILLLGLPVHIARDCPPRDGQHRKHPRLPSSEAEHVADSHRRNPEIALDIVDIERRIQQDRPLRSTKAAKSRTSCRSARASRRGAPTPAHAAAVHQVRLQHGRATTRRGSGFNTFNVTWQLVTF